ncbi:MAG: N-6 DNA methylase [Armatimonadetes bacterium]|nr:N-6 DNA methylase [Armatimonadota bacterium]
MISLDQLRAAARAALGDPRAAMALVWQHIDAEGAPLEWAGIAYESLLAPGDRRRGGSHYTPPELAAEVVAGTLDSCAEPPAAIVDPACGGGAFLLAAARYLMARWGLEPAAAGRRIHGVDRDAGAVEVARAGLLRLTGEAPGSRLRVDDSVLLPAAAWNTWLPAGRRAVITNPPFLGGSFISGTLGAAYRDRLVADLAGGQRGHADLCAYWLLLAQRLMAPGDRAGLVCTNTIAEGTTRRVGLDQLLARGATLTAAVRQRPWPGEATLHYSLVWFTQGPAAGPARLDGRPVAAISAHLTADARCARRLDQNRGLAYNGTKVYGQGFLLTPDEAARLLDDDPRRAAVLKPYLSGDDLYGRADASASRWVIDFGDRSLESVQAEHRDLLARVRELVKPERDQLAGRNTIGDKRAQFWWRFGSAAPSLYRALEGKSEALARVLHSHTHQIVRVPARCVFSHALAVFPDADPARLAVWQSSIHELWALAHGSSLGAAPRYTISQTVETFPLPPLTAELAALGRAYDAQRQAVMANRGEGLTRLWQRLGDRSQSDPDLIAWREAQIALDEAVARAYGWSRPLTHGFGELRGQPRFHLATADRDWVMGALSAL